MVTLGMVQESGQAKARPTLRLFTGIAAPPEINSRLDELVRRLKPLAPIRWSPPANFHITTKFIGYWPEDRVEELKTALRAMSGSGVIRIAIRGLGFFPHARSPRVFWTGVDGGPALTNLAGVTDRICANLGIDPETRAYSPHLTLARIETPAGLDRLREAIAQLPSTEFGEFEAAAVHLYLSRPGRGGSVYTPLAEFPL